MTTTHQIRSSNSDARRLPTPPSRSACRHVGILWKRPLQRQRTNNVRNRHLLPARRVPARLGVPSGPAPYTLFASRAHRAEAVEAISLTSPVVRLPRRGRSRFLVYRHHLPRFPSTTIGQHRETGTNTGCVPRCLLPIPVQPRTGRFRLHDSEDFSALHASIKFSEAMLAVLI